MRIIHMSDLHLPADGELLWGEDCRRNFLTAVGQIKEMQDIHAIIVSGDISNDGNIDSYILCRSSICRFKHTNLLVCR